MSQSSRVFSNPSLIEEILAYAQSLDDVKRLSGTNRASRRSRWPFESLSGHSTIRDIVRGGGKEAAVGRVAEARRLSIDAIGAMIEALSAHRALSAGGSLVKQMCAKCARTLRSGTRASAARAAFSCGYACVRTESGWANAHAIIGACAHAALAAIAFNDALDLVEDCTAGADEDEDRHECELVMTPQAKKQRKQKLVISSIKRRYTANGFSATTWGPREASMWALVQLVHVARKRTTTKSLITQLRQLGVINACARVLSLRDGPSDAMRELSAQLLYLTATGEAEYVQLVSQCDLLESIARFGSSFSSFSTDLVAGGSSEEVHRVESTLRARHAAQFALAHGLHLPACGRKRELVRTMVEEARTALDASEEQITKKAKECIARFAVLAESAAEELLTAGAAELCALVLTRAPLHRLSGGLNFKTTTKNYQNQFVAWSTNEPIGLTAVGDAAICLEQMAAYVGELEATAEEDAEEFDELDDAEREAFLAERDQERSERDRALSALQPATTGLVLQCLSRLNQVAPDSLCPIIASAKQRTVDALLSFLAARFTATATGEFDANKLLDSPHGESLSELMLSLLNKDQSIPEAEDPRFFFRSYANFTCLGLLCAIYKLERGQALLKRVGLTQRDIDTIEEESRRIYFDQQNQDNTSSQNDDDDEPHVFLGGAGHHNHQNGAPFEIEMLAAHAAAQHHHQEDDDDLEEDNDAIYIVVDEDEDEFDDDDDDDDDEDDDEDEEHF